MQKTDFLERDQGDSGMKEEAMMASFFPTFEGGHLKSLINVFVSSILSRQNCFDQYFHISSGPDDDM